MDSQAHYYLDTLGIPTWVEQANTSGTNPWADLAEAVRQCQRCELAKCRTQTVFGTGHHQAELLIVGEAPGQHEDQQGEPFVGRAGELLNAMLESIGLTRSDVFITNILKCRPPENRDPQINEVSQCTPYLDRQIELLQPKVILAVGRFAAHYLLDTQASLSELRTSTHVYAKTNTPLIVSYHPAYLLRKPSAKGEAYRDLCKVRARLKQ